MKKKRVVIIAAAALICAVMCAVSPHIFWHFIYHGDRIKGTISVTIDGNDIPAENIVFSCSSEKGTENVRQDGDKISVKAGEYGSYTITAQTNGYDLKFRIFQYNNWNVTAFSMSYDIDTQSGKVCYCAESSGLTEGGLKDSVLTYTGEYYLNDDAAAVWINSA